MGKKGKKSRKQIEEELLKAQEEQLKVGRVCMGKTRFSAPRGSENEDDRMYGKDEILRSSGIGERGRPMGKTRFSSPRGSENEDDPSG